ncbi:MAG: response regulator [Xanthobacteraceae bacterium]
MQQRTVSMLVADDSHLMQQIFLEAARASKLPLRVSSTDNGRDCLTLLSGGNIDLAFIDVHMPELSGTEAFWAARKQGIQTFVTLMSNPPSTEAVEMARRLKAYEFLFKPFSVGDAVAIIKTFNRLTSSSKVLIVDDSSTVRQIVQKVVKGSMFKCDITEAGDGDTALNLCRTTDFDVVFLDCNMPGLSGLSTMKRLTIMQSALKIVMISSEHDPATENEAMDCGACAFLHKPFHSEDVDRVLHAAYGLRSPTLKVTSDKPDFDVAIEGSTIRLAHKITGHIFEYLWFQQPPHLRNGVVRPAPACAIAPAQVAAVAEKAALVQLNENRLLLAA